MEKTKQISIWDSFGKQGPPDQLLQVGKTNNQWLEIPYKYHQPHTQFTFGATKAGVFKFATRFYISESPWTSDEEVFVTEATEKGASMVPYLKSQLQKAIRRNLVREGCQAAWALLKQSPMELLRRLPIIMVEDKRVHEDLPLVVWGMIKLSLDPQWRIPMEYVKGIMTMIRSLITSPPVDPSRALSKKKPDGFDPKQILTLDPLHKVLVLSLMIRADYGGTNGDVNLLMDEAAWMTVHPVTPISNDLGAYFDYGLPDMNMDCHWIPYAFDFHVTNVAIEISKDKEISALSRTFVEKNNFSTPVSVIKKTMWYYWSSVRYCPSCKKTDPDCPHQLIPEKERRLRQLWELMRPLALDYAHKMIDSLKSAKRKRED